MTNHYEESGAATLWKVLPGITKFLAVIGVVVAGFVGINLIVLGDSVPFELDEDLVRDHNISVGNQDAEVIHVIFEDFQCPACAANSPVLDQALEQYGDRVRFVYKNYPIRDLHPLAQRTSEYVMGASFQGDQLAYEYMKLIFQNQNQGLTVENLEDWAERVGLDVEQLNEDRRRPEIDRWIDWDIRDLNENAFPQSSLRGESKPAGETSGTPTSVIVKNGEIVDWIPGGASLPEYTAIYDKYLTESGADAPQTNAETPDPATGTFLEGSPEAENGQPNE